MMDISTQMPHNCLKYNISQTRGITFHTQTLSLISYVPYSPWFYHTLVVKLEILAPSPLHQSSHQVLLVPFNLFRNLALCFHLRCHCIGLTPVWPMSGPSTADFMYLQDKVRLPPGCFMLPLGFKAFGYNLQGPLLSFPASSTAWATYSSQNGFLLLEEQ